MKKLVIFDMDGVLVDSEKATAESAIAALKHWGIDAEPEDFRPYRGMGERSYLGGPAEDHGVAFVPEMKERMYELYDRNIGDIKVYPWSESIVKKAKAAGYAVAVASAADKAKVDINLRRLGMTVTDFDAFVTGIDVEKKKPAPDIFLMAAAKAGYDPADSVVIEDAIAGVTAGKAAGMTVVAVTTSFPREKLAAVGADVITDDLSSLTDILSKL